MTHRVVVAGELMLDLLLVAGGGADGAGAGGADPPDGLYVRAGGSAANVGRALVGPGCPEVSVVGKTGGDPNGAWVRGELARLSIDLPTPPARDAITGYLVLHRRPGGRDRVAFVERGANARLTPDDGNLLGGPDSVGPDLEGVVWLHLSGYCLLEPGPSQAVRRLAAAARRRGIPVSLDPGVEFHFRDRPRQELIRRFQLGLDHGPDLFFPSAGLARLLADEPGDLGRWFGQVVEKDGPRGAWVNRRRMGLDQPSRHPDADLSGAGDRFNAAFIRAQLAGCSLDDAARRANAAAANYVETGAGAAAPGSDWVRVACQEPPVLVSACLVGVESAYDARARSDAGFLGRLGAAGPAHRVLLPICPEQAGGLPTPRQPAEIRPGGRPSAPDPGADPGRAVIAGTAAVTHGDGREVTDSFLRGARRAVDLARTVAAGLAVLKDGSPSCGSGEVYDGSFSGRKRPGRGVAAAALEELGVTVVGEAAAGRALGCEE